MLNIFRLTLIINYPLILYDSKFFNAESKELIPHLGYSE